MDLDELKMRACDVRPLRASVAVDPLLQLEERREKLAGICRGIRSAAKRREPYTVARNTAKGMIEVNANGWYERNGSYYVTIPYGPKRLSYGGAEVFRADSIPEVIEITEALEKAILAGRLDNEVRAMFSLSEDQKRRMLDGKLIHKVARARANGKYVSDADRARVDRLLKNPEYRDAYDAAFAA
jgi:hypothetical protein